MPIDVHAHYVPPGLISAVGERGRELGMNLVVSTGSAPPALEFEYGFKVRPFFPKLIESEDARRAWLDAKGIDRQLVATWPDIYGYGLPRVKCRTWHNLLNDTLAAWCVAHSDRFSWTASVPMPNAEDAAAELERAMNLGAAAVMIPANVEGVNIGEVAIDSFWAKAQALRAPVIIHPVLVTPAPRAAKFALAQIVQYPSDTTLGIGSLLFSGVLDRFPDLLLVLSHGGGTFPYLIGRFDVMHGRMDRATQNNVAARRPSDYVPFMAYDTIVHAPHALRFLADAVGLDRLVLGSDYSFPPADLDPMAALKAAGLSASEIETIADINPRRLFPRLSSPSRA